MYCKWSAEEWDVLFGWMSLPLKLAKIPENIFGELHLNAIHQVV
jgi:hypothetical protein